jgi:hypothetical protein
MTDRLLFVPPIWISPAGCGELAGIRTALNDFNARFAVELFAWPTVAGAARTDPTWQAASAALREALQTPAHVVTMGSSASIVLVAISGLKSVQSLVAAGIAAPPATLHTAGQASLADIAGATIFNFRLGRRGTYYVLRGSMEGATDSEIAEVARKLDAEIDLAFLGELITSWEGLDLVHERPEVACPTLYLTPRHPLYDGMDNVFRLIVPSCEVDDLMVWPARLHQVESGHDLSWKAIPFIERQTAVGGTAHKSRGQL